MARCPLPRLVQAGGDHYTTMPCWCCPETLQACPECGSDTLLDTGVWHYLAPAKATPADESCWRCKGRGLVPEYDSTKPYIVVHMGVVP